MTELSPAVQAFNQALAGDPLAASHMWHAPVESFTGDWSRRFYPAPHHLQNHPGYDPFIGLAPEALVEEAQFHFEVLERNHGIAVAETYYDPVVRPGGPGNPRVIDSVVEIVEGTPLKSIARGDRPATPVGRAQIARYAHGVLDYLAWIVDTGATRYLADVTKLEQGLLTPAGVKLVDTDPVMAWTGATELAYSVRFIVMDCIETDRLIDPREHQPLKDKGMDILLKIAQRPDATYTPAEAPLFLEP